MGMQYHLECVGCKKKSGKVEFCVTRFLSVKSVPDDYTRMVEHYVRFLIKHSGHKIKFVDSRDNETDPTKIDGKYVLGI